MSLTSQQITELNTQMILAQTAKAEADSRLQEAQALSRTGADRRLRIQPNQGGAFDLFGTAIDLLRIVDVQPSLKAGM